MEKAITVKSARKAYRDVVAVSDVSFDVGVGECLALLGPNGAGKTTMTEILEGYRHADSGEIRVLGEDPLHGNVVWRARLGIVLQTTGDLADLTVREALDHFSHYYPNSRVVDDVIEAVGLTEKAGAKGGRLSGGQRRRLDIALGIIGNPEVLFLDEPTTGFDPVARREFWDLVESLKASGTTILLTTHYLDEAERLADRVAIIARGEIIACDTPQRLGGRGRGVATVSWVESGKQQTEQTATPTKVVSEVMMRFSGEVPELAIHRPSLEDIYLALIGEKAGNNQ